MMFDLFQVDCQQPANVAKEGSEPVSSTLCTVVGVANPLEISLGPMSLQSWQDCCTEVVLANGAWKLQ